MDGTPFNQLLGLFQVQEQAQEGGSQHHRWADERVGDHRASPRNDGDGGCPTTAMRDGLVFVTGCIAHEIVNGSGRYVF